MMRVNFHPFHNIKAFSMTQIKVPNIKHVNMSLTFLHLSILGTDRICQEVIIKITNTSNYIHILSDRHMLTKKKLKYGLSYYLFVKYQS